jgi:outer membrane protein assembly factor BamB
MRWLMLTAGALIGRLRAPFEQGPSLRSGESTSPVLCGPDVSTRATQQESLPSRAAAAGSGRVASFLVLPCIALVMAGCASWDKPKPLPLAPIEKPLPVMLVWQTSLGGSVSFGLQVDVRNGVAAFATDEGSIVALDSGSGEEIWRVDLNRRLSAGVGTDGRNYAVVTRDGELVVLQRGREVWRKRLDVRVVTAPFVAGERVFVLATNRRVQAFDVSDGSKLWSVEPKGEALTLSHTGVLGAQANTLLVGNGRKLAGLDPSDGSTRWEVNLASPRGTNEVERLADLVGPAARVGDLRCARSFENTVACANAARGVILWSRNATGFGAVSADQQSVVAADASGRVTAWRLATGVELWNHDRLQHRELTPPLLTSYGLLFGDEQGNIHVLSKQNGSDLARLFTANIPLRLQPIAAGNHVLVVNEIGTVYAVRQP